MLKLGQQVFVKNQQATITAISGSIVTLKFKNGKTVTVPINSLNPRRQHTSSVDMYELDMDDISDITMDLIGLAVSTFESYSNSDSTSYYQPDPEPARTYDTTDYSSSSDTSSSWSD